jgi:hypothetical protein
VAIGNFINFAINGEDISPGLWKTALLWKRFTNKPIIKTCYENSEEFYESRRSLRCGIYVHRLRRR